MFSGDPQLRSSCWVTLVCGNGLTEWTFMQKDSGPCSKCPDKKLKVPAVNVCNATLSVDDSCLDRSFFYLGLFWSFFKYTFLVYQFEHAPAESNEIGFFNIQAHVFSSFGFFLLVARVLGIGREDDPAGTTGSAQPVHFSHRNSGWPGRNPLTTHWLIGDISNAREEESLLTFAEADQWPRWWQRQRGCSLKELFSHSWSQ